MARKHDVTVNLTGVSYKVPPKTIQKSGVSFMIKAHGKKYGELRIGQGGLSWKKSPKKNHFSCTWEEFSDWIRKEGTEFYYPSDD